MAGEVSFGMVEAVCAVDDEKSKMQFKQAVNAALVEGYMPAGPMSVVVVGHVSSSAEPEQRVPLIYYCFPIVRATGAPGALSIATPGMRVN